jgi:4-alpha-glucanotransferase
VLINLEDLWGETLPQNVPATQHERPNWRRLARYGLEAIEGSAEVADILSMVEKARRS